MTPPWQAAVIGCQIKREMHPCWDGTAHDKKPAGKKKKKKEPHKNAKATRKRFQS
ncbi:hypothetical protein PgNI_06090 [Pyricularia grisea]|uniref:Uncharacterized protein n=1 Tax=Pyricularia grisea TaxID=148305 RepID=A0A6P8B783_PYRGI|nr:hypothetical protein PgNI_06090 [Pyricularia grisea]TLD11172.1 hypothetical protein PgNI_06090 [Pyricularia grisea]